MRVLTVLHAQSMAAVSVLGDLPSSSAVVSAVTDRYNFVRFPTKPHELSLDEGGLLFKLGTFAIEGRQVPIELIQLMRNVIIVSTRTDSVDADTILNDLMSWITDTFGLQLLPFKEGFAHISHLEIRLERPLPDFFPLLASVGRAIQEGLDRIWDDTPVFEPIAITFGFDKAAYPGLTPSGFSIGRRDGIPFDQNVYFSEAQLTTEKHRNALSELEQALLKMMQLAEKNN